VILRLPLQSSLGDFLLGRSLRRSLGNFSAAANPRESASHLSPFGFYCSRRSLRSYLESMSISLRGCFFTLCVIIRVDISFASRSRIRLSTGLTFLSASDDGIIRRASHARKHKRGSTKARGSRVKVVRAGSPLGAHLVVHNALSKIVFRRRSEKAIT